MKENTVAWHRGEQFQNYYANLKDQNECNKSSSALKQQEQTPEGITCQPARAAWHGRTFFSACQRKTCTLGVNLSFQGCFQTLC